MPERIMTPICKTLRIISGYCHIPVDLHTNLISPDLNPTPSHPPSEP